MAEFLERSLEITDWIQISEDNALFAETTAIDQPKCMIDALDLLPKDTAQKVYDLYFSEPLYGNKEDTHS